MELRRSRLQILAWLPAPKTEDGGAKCSIGILQLCRQFTSVARNTSEFATPAFAAAEIRSNGFTVGSESRLGRDAPVRRVVVRVVECRLIGVHDRVDVHA